MADLNRNLDKNIRPLLDAVNTLRKLKVTNEGISLPTIVVVGDQSSGKSSVLESLATINLPRGQGINTRVPQVVLRLERCRDSEESSTTIWYDGQTEAIREDEIKLKVDAASCILAAAGKGVITEGNIALHIRRPDAPDLMMIDLPGITTVPVHGQRPDIYEQIKTMIQNYLRKKETVILNVLSGTVNFSKCESIIMSRQEDNKGVRTLTVVTKVDRAPDDVYKQVTADDVNIGRGYICVRNQTDGDSSHEVAREQERRLFDTHLALSKLAKTFVRVPAVAERLTRIQAKIIRVNLPGLREQIDEELLDRQRELEALPLGVLGDEDPTNVFSNIVNQNKSLLQDVMVNRNFRNLADREELHYPARLDEMFQKFSDNLHETIMKEILPETKTEEILLRMSELRGLTLPNIWSPTLMRTLVSEVVDKVSKVCTDLVLQTHHYAQKFVLDIIDISTNSFPNLNAASKAEAENVLARCQGKCAIFVQHVLDKERSNVFTMSDDYMANVHEIRHSLAQLHSKNANHDGVEVEGFEEPFFLRKTSNKSNEYLSAFDMKVNLAAYCKVVQDRMADSISMDLRYALEITILRNLWGGLLKANMGQDLVTLMEESASTRQKRQRLVERVAALEECKQILRQTVQVRPENQRLCGTSD